MPLLIPNILTRIMQDNQLYPSPVKKVKTGWVDPEKDMTYPMITIRETPGESHAVFPSASDTIIITAWVKGSDDQPYKTLVSDIGERLITLLNKQNVALSTGGLVVNLFVKSGGGFAVYDSDLDIWSYPINFDTVYEEDPANNDP